MNLWPPKVPVINSPAFLPSIIFIRNICSVFKHKTSAFTWNLTTHTASALHWMLDLVLERGDKFLRLFMPSLARFEALGSFYERIIKYNINWTREGPASWGLYHCVFWFTHIVESTNYLWVSIHWFLYPWSENIKNLKKINPSNTFLIMTFLELGTSQSQRPCFV